jgi:hypothetical protein
VIGKGGGVVMTCFDEPRRCAKVLTCNPDDLAREDFEGKLLPVYERFDQHGVL